MMLSVYMYINCMYIYINEFDLFIKCRDSAKPPKLVNKFSIPDAYLFLKRYHRLLYYEDKDNEANKEQKSRYGILDLISEQRILLKQLVGNVDHREAAMFVTKDQSKIVYYSRLISNGRTSRNGIIQVNSLETGQLFGWITCNDDIILNNEMHLAPRWCLSPHKNIERQKIIIKKNPLNRVSTIYYNHVENEIYTGNKDAQIHIWA